MERARFSYPVLIGDIGGTNSRFAILSDSMAEPVAFLAAANSDFDSLEDCIQATVLDKTSLHPKSSILAVAGIVSGDEFELTNRNWMIRPKALLSEFLLEEIVVLNDFEAQALAVVSLPDKDLEQIGGKEADDHSPRVVLGPGTGLGVAGLIFVRDSWVPIAGEGGHVDIGPRDTREAQIFEQLRKDIGRVSAEETMSGRGVLNLYRAVCRVAGDKIRFTAPEDITAAGIANTDKCAAETLNLFVTLLGRIAGDLALIFMSRGGVYLTGGIARNILPALRNAGFRRAFEDKAPHTELIKSIPVRIVVQPLAALDGLAAFARTPERFGIALEGRYWQAAKP